MDSKLEEEYIVSDIDPESIAFMESNDEETNGSATGSLNASLSEDPEDESFTSRLLTMEERCGTSPNADESTNPVDRAVIREEYAKFGESIAVQLAEIPDSYSRSVAKLRINQILFEAEIGVYAQTGR